MSDFNDVFAEPEATPEVPVETTEPEAAPEAEPAAIEPAEEVVAELEPLWKRAGFADEETYERKVMGLSNWEKDLNKKSSKLGAEAKPQPVAPSDGDIFDDLDPQYAEKFRKAIQVEASRIVDERYSAQSQVTNEMFRTAAEKLFAKAAEDNDVSSDELYEFMDTHDLLPANPSLKDLQSKIELAASAMKGRSIDYLVDKKLAEKLADLKKVGGEVKAVAPASTVSPKEEKDDDEENLSFSQFIKRAVTGK